MIRSFSTTTVALTALSALALLATPADAEITEDPGDGGEEGGGGGSEPPPPPPPGYWSKEFTMRDSWGKYGWSAGYSVGGKLSALPKQTVNGKDTLTANAHAKGIASINASSKTLFEVRLTGRTEAKGRTDVAFTGYVAGAAIFSKSWESTTSTHTFLSMVPIDWPATFVDASTTVEVGPVPVTFRVQATGRINANVTGKISNVGLEASANASGKASLYASAAVGGEYCYKGSCVGASAGVYANVTLVEAALPALVKIWWSLASSGGVQINWDMDADLTLKSLDGELGVFAEVSFGETWRWDESLIDWAGFTASYPLFDEHGFYCLSGICYSAPTKF